MTEIEGKKKVVRRIGKLVARITTQGVEVRGRRRRKWRFVPWHEIVKLACKLNPPQPPGWTEDEWANCERKIGTK